jgi:ring-1,2-phenylacetyl-CoA epoxidase subunit PaaC
VSASRSSTAGSGAGPALDPAIRAGLAELLLSMADDEFVSGFVDSEWTGIAPILEEDVAISSISQDELGHARALYELLAAVLDDGRDADAIAYDREPDEYRHACLLDHPRGGWEDTIARRFLYELADEARLASLGAGYLPLAELAEKLRREERYHRMHLAAWVSRLANGGPEARTRLEAALERLAPDAASVFTPLEPERELLRAGILSRPLSEAEAAWRADVAGTLRPLAIEVGDWPSPGPAGRRQHAEAFRALRAEFTLVRHSDPEAAW